MLCQAGVEWNFAYVLSGEDKEEKNPVGTNINSDGVDTTTSLFMYNYINIKGHGITTQQRPIGDYATAPAVEINNTNKGNKPHLKK